MGDWEGVRGLLGLANRAGKLVVGSQATEELMLRSKVAILLLAKDLSPNSASKFVEIAEANSIRLRRVGDKQRIGSALGRGDTGIVGVLDEGLARAILKLLSKDEVGREEE